MRRRRTNGQMLRFTEEKRYEEQGCKLVAGVDEVGRGCLAGPVIAAAVIMPRERTPAWFRKVRDSKLLTPEQREFLSPLIHEAAIAIGTGVVYPDIIDGQGMTKAVRMAMQLAVEGLSPAADFVLVDFLTLPGFSVAHKGVPDGDTLCFSIACASIVAKVYRDHMMVNFDKKFPGYGWAQNKGYSTEEHIACLHRLGPCSLHRRSFGRVRDWAQLTFDDLLRMTVQLEHSET